MPRRLAAREFEGFSAMVALAGFRQLKQTSISVATVTDGTYTITETGTRRAVVIHLAAANGDIRFDYNAAASATDFVLLPARYFVVDCEKNDVLHFFNNNAASVTVYIMEID